MEDKLDIRDELLDSDILENHYLDFQRVINPRMLQFFIDMDSDFESVEFERWLIGE